MGAENSRKRSIAVILGVMVLSASIGGLQTCLSRNSTTETTTPQAANTDSRNALAPNHGSQEAPQVTSQQPGILPNDSKATLNPDATTSSGLFSEVLLRDDACLLFELMKRDKKSIDQLLVTYFSTTPFKGRFEEYSELLLGFETPSTHFGSFYLGLALGHLLDKQGWKNPFDRSYGRAARTLLALARADAGNAAPAAFALISIEAALLENDSQIGISESERFEAIDLLKSASRFDTYIIGYLTDLARFDDPRAVSLLLRTQHLSDLAIPNWNEFRIRWSQSKSLRQDEKLRIIDLMAGNGLQAKKPSNAFGYSYVEHRFAQSLAGGSRSYQSPEQIDAAFPTGLSPNFESTMGKIKFQSPCLNPMTDPATQALRDYAKDLKVLDAGLGVSF